nr:MAG TPA: hypothetical protein [Caudoviricetes sp.]
MRFAFMCSLLLFQVILAIPPSPHFLLRLLLPFYRDILGAERVC